MPGATGRVRQGFRDLLAEERGSVAIIFGLTLVPIALLLVLGVDYARIFAARSNLQQATDAAALAVARNVTSSTTNQQAQAQASVYLANNARGSISVKSATISSDRSTFCLSSQVQINSAFSKFAGAYTGVNALNASANACARMPGGLSPTDTYEIALVLDNSGSMTRSTNGTTKLSALQTAANSFVDTMFSKASSRVKFAVVPFSIGVIPVDPSVSSNRVLSWIDTSGQSSLHWNVLGGKTAATAAGFANSRFDIFTKLKTVNSSWDWGGCMEEQAYPANVNDTPPTSAAPDTLFVPYLAPDEPDSSSFWYSPYYNDYLTDNGGTGACSSSSSGDWADITHVCKYNKPVVSSNYTNYHNWYGYPYGPNGLCPDASSQALMQLSSGQTSIKSKIGQLQAGGNTNLHSGFMWGWRSLSPNAPFSAGRAYDTSGAATNHKIIVFMTDGFNNWGSAPGGVTGSQYETLGYYSLNGSANVRLPDGSNGDGVNYQTALKAAASSSTNYLTTSRNALDDLTLEACANAKAKGIEIFTIGFSISTDPIDEQGLALLQSCATNSSHYFAATDVASLNAAFSTIGVGLGKLRLSQ